MLHTRKRFTVAALGGVIVLMIGLVAASVPLYRWFCEVTGYCDTTQRADVAGRVADRIVTVRFSADVAPGLPWRFRPEQPEVKVRLGEETLVFFSAENLTDEPIVGHATFNVTPAKTGRYFNRIQCFCFDEERLGARQKVDMPADFFVDPALAENPETREVNTITLAYTFFRSAEPVEGRTCRASIRLTLRIHSAARLCSRTAAALATRSTAARPDLRSPVFSAARPQLSRAIPLRPPCEGRGCDGPAITLISGSPTRANSFPARECRSGSSTQRQGATLLPFSKQPNAG